MNVDRKVVLSNLIVLSALCLSCENGHPGQTDKAASPGTPGKVADVTQSITITTQEMKFSPAEITVHAGETVRLVVSNVGREKHEFVIGPDKGAEPHAEANKENEAETGESNEVEVEPGQTKNLIWTFGPAGTVEFACHQPGHYEAMMTGQFVVEK